MKAPLSPTTRSPSTGSGYFSPSNGSPSKSPTKRNITTESPLDDKEVKAILDQVTDCRSPHDFKLWQQSFLNKFTRFLDTEGSRKAARAYKSYSRSNDKLIAVLRKLQKHIDDGNLSPEKITVKAQKSMSELKACLTKQVGELRAILPTSVVEAKTMGFSKYHMAAVLVKEEFQEYAVMMFCRCLLKVLRHEALDDVADSQILDEIDYYNKSFDVFCGVMESLHLLDPAKVAQELLHAGLVDEAQEFQEKLGCDFGLQPVDIKKRPSLPSSPVLLVDDDDDDPRLVLMKPSNPSIPSRRMKTLSWRTTMMIARTKRCRFLYLVSMRRWTRKSK